MPLAKLPKRGDVLLGARPARRVRVVERSEYGYVLENLATGRRSGASAETVKRDYSIDKRNTNRGKHVRRSPASNLGRPPAALDQVIALLARDALPSVPELAADAGVNERTVRRYLERLAAENRLEVEVPDRAHDPYRYRLKDPNA